MKALPIVMLLALASVQSLAAATLAEVTPKLVDAYATDADANAYLESLRAAMQSGNDPREWALATFPARDDIDDPGTTARTHAELARAAKHAPNDALVQWLAVNTVMLADPSDADIAAALSRLETLEPDNAAVWMQALLRAVNQHDEAAASRALDRMAQSARFDEHFADTLHAWLAVYDRHPPAHPLRPVPDGKAEVSWTFASAMAITTAVAMPSYATLTNACKETSGKPLDAERRAQCTTIGRLMLHRGLTLVSRAIGFAVLRNVGALSDADLAENRNLDWYRANVLKGTGFEDGDVTAKNAFENDWRRMNDEIAVLQSALARAGLPTQAPPDWSPQTTRTASHAKS